MTPPSMTPVFVAANSVESERVERLLDHGGIEFNLTPEASLRSAESDVCLMGVLFEVAPEDAERARELISGVGLAAFRD